MTAVSSILFDVDPGVTNPAAVCDDEFVHSAEDSSAPLLVPEPEALVSTPQPSPTEAEKDEIAQDDSNLLTAEVQPSIKADEPAVVPDEKAALLHSVTETKKAVIEKRRSSEQSDISNCPRKEVYKFQVSWDPVRKMDNLGYHIRRHVLIAPYRGDIHAAKHIQKAELPEDSPLSAAVKQCRAKGIPVVTGYWKYWNNPIAILFDLKHMPQEIVDRYIAELNRDHGVEIPTFDDKCRLTVVLGYCAAEFIIQFELAIDPEKLSKKSWIRFHNWTAASGALFLPHWFKPRTKIVLLVSKTQLVDLIPKNLDEGMSMAMEARVAHRYDLETTAAANARQLIIPKGVASDMIGRELDKTPSHQLVDPVPRLWADFKGFFLKFYRKPKNRMSEKMYTNEKKAYEDLKMINIPVIRTIRVKGG